MARLDLDVPPEAPCIGVTRSGTGRRHTRTEHCPGTSQASPSRMTVAGWSAGRSPAFTVEMAARSQARATCM